MEIIREWILSNFDFPTNAIAHLIYQLCHQISNLNTGQGTAPCPTPEEVTVHSVTSNTLRDAQK
ncbi:MAG: hypothetical protein ACI4DZ_02275 [Oliverpabstia sp.]